MQEYSDVSKKEVIEKVFISENGIICIKPQKLSFNMIYRSTAGVHWNDDGNYLFHNPPQKWSPFHWYEHILKAVKIEYGVQLKIMPDTVYENLDEGTVLAIKNQII
jgi:hypothetical protein